MRFIFLILFFFLSLPIVWSQNIPSKQETNLIVKDSVALTPKINPLAPSKAAFYSAVFPGMGQVYNKKYWKLPLVYGAIGTSLYFYINNNKKYHLYRDAYKNRLAGISDNYSYLDNTRLIQAQKFYQKNRDLSALLMAAFYILNIVDANVDAHLMQYNVNDNLSLKPDLYKNDYTAKQNLGLTLSYKF
ncbi:DUF5683 domain-containing protein [Flavobacterium croceum]|uniref:DUF5683 domain-containing protein n=1 Tax=Flavobacterium croceum TaxID=370975 RepID=UPI0024A999E3|nr:DUF5683 domain-containing protein [Flavobacterium croceum]